MVNKNYVSREQQLLKRFDKTISRYSEEQTKTFIRESRQEYETLIPEIPYIGDENPFLIFM